MKKGREIIVTREVTILAARSACYPCTGKKPEGGLRTPTEVADYRSDQSPSPTLISSMSGYDSLSVSLVRRAKTLSSESTMPVATGTSRRRSVVTEKFNSPAIEAVKVRTGSGEKSTCFLLNY
jgi:hypothetical protein